MDVTRKRTADLIDELSIVNIKIFFLEDKLAAATNAMAGQYAKMSRVLNKQRSALRNALAERLDPDTLADLKIS